MQTKTCSKCGATKPATIEHFGPDPSNVRGTGLRADCRACANAVRRGNARRRRAERRAARQGARPESPLGGPAECRPKATPAPVESPAVNTPPPIPPPPPRLYAHGSRNRRGYILPDIHGDQRDRPAYGAALRLMDAEPPDGIVIIGDGNEFRSCDSHGGQRQIVQLEDEFATGRQLLRELRERYPEADIAYLEGNHETKVTRWLLKHAPQLADSLTVPGGLDLDRWGALWIPEGRQPWDLGTLRLAHGHQLAGPGGRLPIYHAAKAAQVWGRADKTVVIAHGHRAGTFARPQGIGETAAAVALGCLCLCDPEWQHAEPNGWTHQMAVFYESDCAPTALYPITIHGGRLVWGGTVYGG